MVRRFWKRDRLGRFASSGSSGGAAESRDRKPGRLRQIRDDAAAFRAQQRRGRQGTTRAQRRDARRAAVAAELAAQERRAWGIYGSEAAFNRAATTYEAGGGTAAFRRAHERQTEAWRRG